MPTQLKNGVVVYNLTSHAIPFEDEKTGEIVVAPSDGVLNARIQMETIQQTHSYRLSFNYFEPTKEGKYLLAGIRQESPEALIIGSMAAAQAYPEDVVAQVPTTSHRKEPGRAYTARTNRFTTFKRSNNHG